MNCYIWPAFFKQVMIKELARKLLPSTARQKVSALYHEQKLFKAARVLAQAKGMSEVLDEKTFDTLMAAYPVGERMSYDNDSVKNRGDERANEMMEVMNRYGKGGFSDVLELGSEKVWYAHHCNKMDLKLRLLNTEKMILTPVPKQQVCRC